MLSGDEIHIFELLPYATEGPAAPLRCHVHTASLSRDPDYEAVSYVWGDPKQTTGIEIDGRDVQISMNLATLLQRIRHSNRKRDIWADQICIDQGNVDEKTAQVHMMGDVYSKCRQCLIWMGEIPESIPASDVEAAIHLLKFMAAPENINAPSYLTSNDEFRKVFKVLCEIHPHRNSWWSRIWTVQEVILPRKKTIIWGPHELSWELLSRAMYTWTTRYIAPLNDVLLDQDIKEMNVLSSNVVWINDGRNTDLPSILAVKWLMEQAGSTHILGVSGVKVDKVQIISPEQCAVPDSDLKVSERLQAWYKLAVANRLESTSVRPETQEEFCRLVVGDILESRGNEASYSMPTKEVLEHVWRFVTEGKRKPGEIWIKQWHMPGQLFDQVFFLTASGMMGLGPWDTRVGDEVWILNGANNPFVIRPRHHFDTGDAFDSVGCAYVQGIMFGEWLRQRMLSPKKVYLH
ncbi:Heterokaryon incompatibility protein 6 [Diaporthe amygdali]|uniref:Heterokaryon incompatibility protein 6 n=1 Tax=Phomopsis amygdali TaxID=1214568 RepID=UPI0022FDF3C1|nr:Heterokaryon incompatibility protein 6 [Diaporthe amygdali]KAJ0122501.1 Heterokaryon incompatibility protein 6 [Diaporthe amygdali]